MNAARAVAVGGGLMATVALFFGCAEEVPSQPAKSEAPAKLEGRAVKEADLNTIILTPEAEERLGIRIEAAIAASAPETRRLSGEVTAPPGKSFVVASSVAGTLQTAAGAIPPVGSFVKKDQPIFRLTPLVATSRDVEVSAKADLDQSRTRLEAARIRKARAEKMLADEVGTVRGVEEAQQEVELATTAIQAAEARFKRIQTAPLDADVEMTVPAPDDGILRQVLAAPGQTVSAGTPLFEIVDLRTVWIRVPVYAGELSTLVTSGRVTVQALNCTGTSRTAVPVQAPPSADATASTVNVYYSLSNQDLRFRPGEKLLVTLQGADVREWIRIPASAVVLDTSGGTWVYESLGDRRYALRRIDVDHTTSGVAFLAAGVPGGTRVVADGAAELWGFEFGTGK
jgi:membrane fusion protein, heavy metal efflux system